MKTGITGGIGSGKSYVCRLLRQRGISVYDCDTHAKRLMAESPKIRRELTRLIGPEAYQCHKKWVEGREVEEYRLNKPVIARFLMESDENAKALEQIVHPQVLADYVESGMEWVESAILFESGLYRLVDRVVVVTAPEEVRIERIMARDGISREKALGWMQRQMTQKSLMQRADHIIVNDGDTPLTEQLSTLLDK